MFDSSCASFEAVLALCTQQLEAQTEPAEQLLQQVHQAAQRWPAGHEAGLALFEQAVQRYPERGGLVQAWLNYLKLALPEALAQQWLLEQQAQAPQLRPALFSLLARWGHLPALHQRCAAQIQAWRYTPLFYAAEEFVQTVSQALPLAPGLAQRLLPLSLAWWHTFVLLRQPQARILMLPAPEHVGGTASAEGEAATLSALAEVGLSLRPALSLSRWACPRI